MPMKKISKIMFSMQTMGVLILLFAFAIGTATFIENDFGTTASKAVVYNATWFNVLLLLLTINLVGRIIIGRMYVLKKLPVFTFHIAFIIILLGSGITRFISYEGMMHIREGSSSNTMLSDNTYIDIVINDGSLESKTSSKVFLSNLTPGAYSSSVSLNNKKYRFNSIKYIPNASETINPTQQAGEPIIVLTFSEGGGRQNYYLKYGQNEKLGSKNINFADEFDPNAVNVKIISGDLSIYSGEPIALLSMTSGAMDTLAAANWHSFKKQHMYTVDGVNLVLSNFYPNAKVDYETYTGKQSMMNALVVEVDNGSEIKEIALRGGKGYKGEATFFEMDGVNISMTYGAKEIQLPFEVKLVDFKLERYPGSMSPSSYASDVTLIDKKNNVNLDYNIYMNHVLNYGGYRFFQSSYDSDEHGTILSVAHDYWGTFFTYLGYFLMSLGMLLSIFSKNTQFAALGRVIKKVNSIKTIALIATLLVSAGAFAQHNNIEASKTPVISEKLANQFGQLLVQSQDGRLKPVNSLSSEVLRKISRKSKLDGLSADQVLLGMMVYPRKWQQVPMIKVTHPELKKLLGIEGKYASYIDFITSNGNYKLSKQISEAYEKNPSKRGKFDNDVMKVDERLNICFMVYNSDMLKILPDPFDSHHSWYSPVSEFHNLPQEDSMFLKAVVPAFLSAVSKGNASQTQELLVGIADYQQKYGAEIWPSKNKIKYETLYNELLIFNNLSKLYGLLGFIMIILLFVDMSRTSKALRVIVNILIGIVVIGFVVQTGGLIMRWYISGYAPWSNGYESMIYIAWVTLLAGLFFSSGSKMTIAATTILSSIILMVAHLSWMDPEITNLVPVLKSYWLTIHVSVITASYGFLALSALLGFFNLIFMIIKSNKNAKKINNKIAELTAINKRSVMIGLYLLTIGTFLGGVWANESWGRYWGWDPKETWALVSVLVYAFIAHMSYMPGLKSKFIYNFAALISYGVVLMTYFGVNYYLSGLHSYANGDPVPVPNGVYYAIAVVIIIGAWAYSKDKKLPS